MYDLLTRAARVTGHRVVPGELINGHAARDGYSEKLVKVGSLSFYLLRPEDMQPGLKQRFETYSKAVEDGEID